MKTVRIAAAQTPDFHDDTVAAMAHLNDVSARAKAQGVRLLVFPEGYLQGYILNDQDARRVAFDLGSQNFKGVLEGFPPDGPMVVVGLIEIAAGQLFNTAIVVRHRALIGKYRKMHLLAAEGIFCCGSENPVFEIDGLRFGISICYDTNFPDTIRKQADLGAALIVCCANNMMARLNAETYRDVHNAVRADRCREAHVWMMSADVTGERDGMVSWGPSAIIAPTGEVVAQLALGVPGLLTFDVPIGVTSPDRRRI